MCIIKFGNRGRGFPNANFSLILMDVHFSLQESFCCDIVSAFLLQFSLFIQFGRYWQELEAVSIFQLKLTTSIEIDVFNIGYFTGVELLTATGEIFMHI